MAKMFKGAPLARATIRVEFASAIPFTALGAFLSGLDDFFVYGRTDDVRLKIAAVTTGSIIFTVATTAGLVVGGSVAAMTAANQIMEFFERVGAVIEKARRWDSLLKRHEAEFVLKVTRLSHEAAGEIEFEGRANGKRTSVSLRPEEAAVLYQLAKAKLAEYELEATRADDAQRQIEMEAEFQRRLRGASSPRRPFYSRRPPVPIADGVELDLLHSLEEVESSEAMKAPSTFRPFGWSWLRMTFGRLFGRRPELRRLKPRAEAPKDA